LEEVLYVHERALEAFGGASGIRDESSLKSAVATPTHTYDGEFLYKSLTAMAAAYWFGISENQAFLDGNKRTAILACEAFLNLNGLELTFDDERQAYDVAMRITNHEISREELARLIDANVAPLSD
jgi:death-on-curing protein